MLNNVIQYKWLINGKDKRIYKPFIFLISLCVAIDKQKREEKGMALIQCPKCGKEVSDYAKECPQCGQKIKEEEQVVNKCVECGEILGDGQTVCHKCGCPVENSVVSEQIIENVPPKNKKQTKTVIILVLVILAMIGIVAGAKYAQEVQKEKERIAFIENYSLNLQLASATMLDGAADAEKAGGLIGSVWHNSIYGKSDPETDKYTAGASDFNEAIGALFDDETFQTKITAIEENQKNVKELMKGLKNPPEEYEEAYSAIKEYYDVYLKFTNLVINPTGSLQTYTDEFNEADAEVLNCYNAMAIYNE